MRVDVVPSAHLDTDSLAELRRLLDAAFGTRFTDADWAHALGGSNFVIRNEGRMIAHAAVVARTFTVGDVRMHAGYIEAVATEPGHQHQSYGSAVMRRVAESLHDTFDIGALSTGSPAFYTRLGWEQWRGPTFVDAPAGRLRTARDDGWIYVLRTPRSAMIDVTATLACDWRAGDVW